MKSERPVGVILWLVLIVGVTAYVVLADLWLHSRGYEMLTTEFKEGLRNMVYGPLIVGFSAGLIGGLVWHFFTGPRPK